jgi:hypothetical protein
LVKQFEEFNRKYARLAGTALKTIRDHGGRIPQEDIDNMVEWPADFKANFTEAYDQTVINFVVYRADTADAWQRFRVSLKGLNTKEKLYALTWWWEQNVDPMNHTAEHVRFTQIRVNNYLGALKRSGHLDSNLRVAKL